MRVICCNFRLLIALPLQVKYDVIETAEDLFCPRVAFFILAGSADKRDILLGRDLHSLYIYVANSYLLDSQGLTLLVVIQIDL